MMPRKKRLAIIISIIVLIILLIAGILAFLYLKTDAFKSNETLFTKYLAQNFNIVETLIDSDTSKEIKATLDNTKYTSELTGKLEYTENIDTSDENTDNPINDAQIKISSKTDKSNNYYYKDIKIVKNDENLMRAEYLNEDKVYAIRLDGIKQFVSIDTEKITNNTDENSDIKNIEALFTDVNLDDIFKFTEEEKETLKNTYMNIVRNNVSKEKYSKQADSLITVNNKEVITNAYSLSLTKEQYNNLIIKILEQISNDEIILSRIDKIEEIIKEKYSSYDAETTLRETFVEYIKEQIEDIKNNNIGNDEVKITVYESKGTTIRTTIQTNTGKLNIDLYNNIIKFDNVEYSETENEAILQIEKDNTETGTKTYLEYEKITDNEVVADLQLIFEQNMENNSITNTTEIVLKHDKYKADVAINENIELVDEFDEQIKIEDDNVELNELNDDQTTSILNILIGNIENQIGKFNENIPFENYIKMLQNLNILKNSTIEISDTTNVTETEKNRFNSQFEFFASQNLTTENIKELVNSFEDKFEDMYIILKSGEEQELDVSQIDINNSSLTSSDYIKNIDEIDIKIKQNSTNENKKEDLLKLIEKVNKKYDVSLEYDDNGLVNKVKLKIKE